jgi:citrate synthase/citryl-CoA lyase
LSTSNSTSAPPIWTTSLSETTAETIAIRGYDIAELIGGVPFPAVVHLLYTGELPDPPTARLIDALMVASIDHGAGAPSVLAARTAVSGGATLQAAAAAGLLTLGEFHGAAVDASMRAIATVVDATRAAGSDSMSAAADDLVADWRAHGKRIPGFGHRQHKRRDPRLDRLLSIARDADVSGDHLAAAIALEAALTRAVGKPTPINIDGVMAAILNEVGFPSDLGNALFIASRLAGILAHANEERQTMTPMRRVDPMNHSYRGPDRRAVPSAGAMPAQPSGAQVSGGVRQ